MEPSIYFFSGNIWEGEPYRYLSRVFYKPLHVTQPSAKTRIAPKSNGLYKVQWSMSSIPSRIPYNNIWLLIFDESEIGEDPSLASCWSM